MKKLLASAAVFTLLAAGWAYAFTPTLDPSIPAQDSQRTSAQMRGQFQSIYNDEVALGNMIISGLSGDVTTGVPVGGVAPATLATVLGTPGNYGTGTSVPTITVDAKGRIIAAANQPLAIGTSQISGLAPSAYIDTTDATNITSGVLGISFGGTGQTTRQAAINALLGGVASGQYARGNGTNVVMSAIQVADVPTLNQNTTGSAATFTGPLAGDVTGTQSATAIAATTVTGKAITGFSAGAGTVTASDTILTALNKIVGNINGLVSGVSSVFGRTGAVVAQSGDYSFSQISGTAAISQGGTGQITQQLALNALVGGVTSGQYPRGNGTNIVLSGIQAADVPTLNQSTTGNAATATALQTPRTINGVSFDGTGNIVVTAAAGTLTGSTLAAGVTASSLTSVGTLTGGTWNATAIGPTFGGTGQTTYTTGDVLYASATNTLSKLPIGTTNQVITVVGGVPTWQNPSGGGGSGTVNSGTATRVGYYATTGTAISDNALLTFPTSNSVAIGTASTSALSVTGTQAITSASATAFTAGANGATNPVFTVNANTASVVSGVSITGAATGVAPTIATTDSATNSPLTIASKGNGQLTLQAAGGTVRINGINSAGQFIVVPNSSARLTVTDTNTTIASVQTAILGSTSTGTGPRIFYTPAADTTLTASTSSPLVNIGTTAALVRQHATGALALQPDYNFYGTTDSYVGASVQTRGATVQVFPKTCGTNGTCTNISSIYVPATAITATTGNGIEINATTGATNNNAAVFFGNVGIGTSIALASFDNRTNTDAIGFPGGTTAQRPSNAFDGFMRVNTSPVIKVVESFANGVWGMVTPWLYSGMDTAATAANNTTAFQTQVNKAIAIGTSTLSSDWGVPPVQMPFGTYAMQTLTIPPWVKVQTQGTVRLDYSAAVTPSGVTNAITPAGSTPGTNDTLHFATTPAACIPGAYLTNTTHPTVMPTGGMVTSKTGTSIVMSGFATGGGVASGDTITCSYPGMIVNNDVVPTNSLYENSADLSPFPNAKNGTLNLLGPGGTTTAIGMLFGSQSDSPGSDANTRDMEVANLSLVNWGGTGIMLRASSLYINTFKNIHITVGTPGTSTNCIATSQAANSVNSGENLSFNNVTLDGCVHGMTFDVPTMDTTFNQSSIDFVTNAFNSTSNDGFAKHALVDSHIEGVTTIFNGTASNNGALRFIVRDSKLVNDTGKVLFKGNVHLDVDGLYVGGYGNPSSDPANLFMTDANVIAERMENIEFSEYAQLTSPKLLVSNDSCFAGSTVGNDLNTTPPTTWTGDVTNTGATANTGITATFSNAVVWTTGVCNTSKSLRLARTNSTNSQTWVGNRIPIRAGERLGMNVVLQTNNATSAASIQTEFLYSYCNASITPVAQGFFGDTVSNLGGANTWLMMHYVNNDPAPAGVCYAQPVVNISGLGTTEVVYIGFTGATRL